MTRIYLTTNEHRVICAMQPHIGGRIYHAEIAKGARLSRSSLPRIINRLIDKGAVRRVYPGHFEFPYAEYVLPRMAGANRAKMMAGKS